MTLSTGDCNMSKLDFFICNKKRWHCKLLHPDEKPYLLKKSKEKKSYKCNYKYSKENVYGQESTTYHQLYKHKKLNSHARN